MIIGCAIAAYSIVSHDSIQTLGTFLSLNAHSLIFFKNEEMHYFKNAFTMIWGPLTAWCKPKYAGIRWTFPQVKPVTVLIDLEAGTAEEYTRRVKVFYLINGPITKLNTYEWDYVFGENIFYGGSNS